jgi:hypothetical protein
MNDSRYSGPAPALALGLLATALSLTACGEEFDPGSEVDSMRVLAVSVDNPFASPGETVRLEALSYDPGARAISWAWAVCAEPASSSVESCLANVLETSITTGTPPLIGMGEGQNGVELTIAPDAIDRLPPQARPQGLVGVLSVACPGSLQLAPNGASPLLPFRCTDLETGRELGLDEAIVGIKRVFLRQTERNQNPAIASILFDGEGWPEADVKEVDGCDTEDSVYDDCPSELRHRIQAVIDPQSFEAGMDEFGRDFSEDVIVQHYTEAGIVKDEVRIASAWLQAASPSFCSAGPASRAPIRGMGWGRMGLRVRQAAARLLETRGE